MSKRMTYVVKWAVKKLERLPRSRRHSINRALDFILFSRKFRERKLWRDLSSTPKTGNFIIDRNLGFTKFSSERLATERMISVALAAKERHLKGNLEKGNSKDYLRQIWDLSKLDEDTSFILDWALQDSTLYSVSKYFGGKTPILHEISIFYSPETSQSDNKTWQGSQLFHMDGGGTQCVKLWLLCQDINVEQGPTVVVSAGQSEKLAKRLKYRPGTKIQNDQTLSGLEPLDTFSLVGERGTWYATDTDRSFHYGSRTTEKASRLVFMFHYVDNNSSYYMPILSKHYRQQLKELPAIARKSTSKTNAAYESLKYRI
jgi:hypothetical protein